MQKLMMVKDRPAHPKIYEWAIFMIAIFMLLVSSAANAYYVSGNQYYIVTNAATPEQYLSCPAKSVSSSQVCNGYATGYTTQAGWCGRASNPNTFQGGSAESCGHSSDWDARIHCRNFPTWTCTTWQQTTQVPYQYCTGYSTQYTIGGCLTEAQARNAGLGSYLDQQLATYNAVPVADAKSLTTQQETAGSVTVSGSDSDGTVTSYAIVQQSPNGTAVLSGTTLTFTPNAGWSGNTTVTYRVQDNKGAWSNPATVSITVIPNQKPVAANVVLTTKEDVAGSVTISATDADDPVPTHFEVHSQSSNGTATIDGSVLTFTPNKDWFGTTTLTYRAKDARGAWSNPAVVTVVVTERKVVLSDFTYNSVQRAGTFKAVGVDEVPQDGKAVLRNADDSVAYEVAAARQAIDPKSASYAYDLRNAPSGTYTLWAEVKDQRGGTELLEYGEITIFVVKTLDFTYDPVTRMGQIVVEDKGEILDSAELNLLNGSGATAFSVALSCQAAPDMKHVCGFDLNNISQGKYQARIVLTDDFNFQFTSDHGEILIDKTAASISTTIPVNGQVGTIDEVLFTVVDNYDQNVTIESITLTGGADNIELDLNWTRNGADVKPGHFAMFPSMEGDPAYTINIKTIDHQLNQSERSYTFTYNPELMELVTDLSKLGMDGRLGIPAVPAEFVRQGGGATIETKQVKRRNGQPLTGQHDIYVTMRSDAFAPMRFNGHLIHPGQTVRIEEAHNFDTTPGLSIPIQAEIRDLVGSTTFLLSIAAPETPVLAVPMYTWKGDVTLQSNMWEFRQVVDPLNIVAMPAQGVPCRVTVDEASAKKADPISDPVCLVEWTETPDEAEMSLATVGGMQVAALIGQAVRMGEQKIRYNLHLYSGDGTKVNIGSGERSIKVVSALNSILFDHDLPNKRAYRLIDDLVIRFKQTEGPACNLTLNAQQAMQTGARSFQSGEVFRDCLFEWQQIPQGLQQNTRAETPVAVGFINDLGDYTLGWRLSIYSRSGTRITLAEQTSDFSIVNPPAPTVEMTSAFEFQPGVMVAPVDARELGDATLRSESAVVRMAVNRDGNTVDSEVYPRRPDGSRNNVMRRVNMTNNATLWEPMEYSIKGSYERMPELFDEKKYTVYAGPIAGTRPMLEVDQETALDTDPLKVRVRMGDLYNLRSPYDPSLMGEWRVRLKKQAGLDTSAALTEYSDMTNGQTEFVLDISNIGEKQLRMVGEAELISPIEGYKRTEISTRPLAVMLLYGGAIKGDLAARSISGPAPFNAVLKAVFDTRDMQASTGKIVWETSLDNGSTWEEFVPEERYKLQYVRTFETGKYLVRARMYNKYSGIESQTETVEIIAYDQPVLELNGPSLLFEGSEAKITASAFLESAERVDGRMVKVRTPISTDGLIIDWSYDMGKTYTDVGPEVTIQGDSAKRVSVWARVRSEMAPANDQYAYSITKGGVEFKPVKGPRVRTNGPRIVEVGKTYTYEASASLPYNGLNETIEGEFILPDGSTVRGTTASYTPTDEDMIRGNLEVRYNAWIVGWQDKGATGTHSVSSRVWKYEFPEFAFEFRGDYQIAPTTATLRLRPKAFTGTLESPVYKWDIPAGIKVTAAASDTHRDFEITSAGDYVIRVTVTDARGNEAVVEYPMSIAEPDPWVANMRQTYSHREMREPLDVVMRPEISGGHPRDRVMERHYFVNGQKIPNSGIYGRTTLNHGEYELKLRYVTLHGKTGEATEIIKVEENKIPVCTMSSRPSATSVRVTAECDDIDGRVRGYEWSINGRVTSSSAQSITVNFRSGEPMPVITLVGIDDANGRSAPVTLTLP